jgi:Arc/MetJ-type ribon-helix-helix transcriptional regulator
MPRNHNKIETKKITISTTPKIVEKLRELVASGFYGKNEADAAERLLAKELERRFGGDTTNRGDAE